MRSMNEVVYAKGVELFVEHEEAGELKGCDRVNCQLRKLETLLKERELEMN